MLSLEKNQLTTLPPQIGQLTNLQRLHLQDNQLTTLPPGIGQLTNLTHLYLRQNQLTSLPPEIEQLPKLEILYLVGNTSLDATSLALVQRLKAREDGGGGVSGDFELASAWANVRTLRFADGPDEVHNRAIARAEFGKYPDAKAEVPGRG